MRSHISLTTLAAIALCACSSTAPVKLVNWNTYHLFDHGAQRSQAAAWLADERPSIVALQEVLHVDAQGLRQLAAEWNHEHAVMHKESGYPVALTSSAPIEVLERRTEGFHHGYLHARTHDLDVFVVHFWPDKVHEAEHVAARARALVDAGHPVLVVGDFNAVIRHDEDYLHEHGHLGEVIDGTRRFDYRITDAFLDAGFVDLVHNHAPGATYTFGSPALIPRWREDMQDVIKTRRRIDFVFADEVTAARASAAQVETDDSTVGKWSDHYPVIVDLER